MVWFNPLYEEHQRRRFTRPDGQRFIRPDAHRFLTPAGIAEEKRAAQARADAALAAEQKALDEELWRIRRDLTALKTELALARAAELREAEELRIKSNLAFDRFLRGLKRQAEQRKAGFNPDQPRDDHGKWTDGGQTRDAGKDGRDDRARSTDISAQRRIGPRPPGTPAQNLRLDIANARAHEAIARVQQLDPNWRPESATSFDNRSNMEVMIRAKEAEWREADARFVDLSRAGHDAPYALRDPPTTTEVLMPGGKMVGYRVLGGDRDARTVTPAEFESIRVDLMGGARRVDPGAGYDGVWYQRQDGSRVGLRLSADHGLTLDVIENDHPLVYPGLKVHQR
jgi:hypothetical protein